MESNRSLFYRAKNFFTAEGDVVFTQGDSLKMTCTYLEYDGQIKKAKAWGNVVLKAPRHVLGNRHPLPRQAYKQSFLQYPRENCRRRKCSYK